MKKILVILICLFGAAYAQQTYIKTDYKISGEENAFIDSLQYKAFLYFLNEINPENGLVKDRSNDGSPASIAATGFALPVWAVGAEHKWISRSRALDLSINLLRFFLNSEQSLSPDATGYHGLYYHFLDMKNGKRYWKSELSTIDTGLLFAGIIFCKNYYKGNSGKEKLLRHLCRQIMERVNWNFMTMPDSGKYANTINLGWDPEQGYSDVGWVGYNEALIMYIIAAGTNFTGYKAAYDKWLSFYEWRKSYNNIELLSFPPLFGHQYSHIYIDFRNIKDRYMREKGLDYFENSRRAVFVQRLYAIDNPMKWKDYDSLTWGISACDGPGEKYNFNDKKFDYYNARGVSGPDLIQNDDGTIAPTASVSSICFAPELVIPSIYNMYKKYGNKGLWGKYGFVDAFNPTAGWFDKEWLGIDQAPIILMIENFRSGLIWKYMMKDPVIKTGLGRLNFKK